MWLKMALLGFKETFKETFPFPFFFLFLPVLSLPLWLSHVLWYTSESPVDILEVAIAPAPLGNEETLEPHQKLGCDCSKGLTGPGSEHGSLGYPHNHYHVQTLRPNSRSNLCLVCRQGN